LRVDLEQVDRTRGNDQSNPASALPALASPPPGPPMPPPGGAPLEAPVAAGFAPPSTGPIATD